MSIKIDLYFIVVSGIVKNNELIKNNNSLYIIVFTSSLRFKKEKIHLKILSVMPKNRLRKIKSYLIVGLKKPKINDLLTIDTATGGARNERGKTYAPEVPGLGIEPKMDVLDEAIAVYE